MSTKQYTIRNIPGQVDRYLRKRAQLSGKSLNQTILDELSEKASDARVPAIKALDWFIGSGLDDETQLALEQEEIRQKMLAKKELLDDSRH